LCYPKSTFLNQKMVGEGAVVKKVMRWLVPVVVLAGTSLATSVQAATCDQLPSYAELKAALQAVTGLGVAVIGGDGHPAWLTLVDASGVVCAVVAEVAGDVTQTQSGLGHRVLSAYKANTSNAYSHTLIALASAHFYWLQLQGGAMVNTTLPALDIVARDGPEPESVATWGTADDPMVGQRIGGFSPLAGGLPLFDASKHKVGAIGVSGNPFCTAHAVAWRVRDLLPDRNGTVGAYNHTNVPGSVACQGQFDAMIQDVIPGAPPNTLSNSGPGASPSFFGYPECNFPPPKTFANGIVQDATAACSP
jgi:uncharacterized protein GlcG (DUF336 family)